MHSTRQRLQMEALRQNLQTIRDLLSVDDAEFDLFYEIHAALNNIYMILDAEGKRWDYSGGGGPGTTPLEWYPPGADPSITITGA